MTTNPEAVSIKQPRQWELLASEGHVLLARIDAYRTRLKLPLAVATAAIFLAWAGYLASPFVGSAVGAAIGWITKTASSIATPSALKPSPAGAVLAIRPNVPDQVLRNLAIASVPTFPETVNRIRGHVDTFKASGQVLAGCRTDAKITDAWTTGDSATRCKLSADGKRLWMWGIARRDGASVSPYAFLLRKDDKGAVTAHTLESKGLPRIETFDVIPQVNIPRTIAQDFPELAVASMPPEQAMPALLPLQAVMPADFKGMTMADVPLASVAADEMLALVDLMKSGQRFDGCNSTGKITEDWISAPDPTPSCRYSADGKRLWVWGLVKRSSYSSRPEGFLAMLRKTPDGNVTPYTLNVENVISLQGWNAISPTRIPRTVGADFPELVQK